MQSQKHKLEFRGDWVTDESAALLGASAAKARRRIAEMSAAAAVTTQERLERYHEKSNKDRECWTSRTGQRHGVFDRGSSAPIDKTIENFRGDWSKQMDGTFRITVT